jgi:two-component system, sensor histidine kinase and response regulator
MTEARAAVDPAALDRLLDMTGGDPEFLAELIDTFLEDGAVQLEALRHAVAAGDAEAALRPAHSLKSNSASMGAEHLAGLARDLEADARSGAIDDGPARIEAATAEFEAVRAALLAIRQAP